MRNCSNCAWYCHYDKKCYVPCMSRACEVNEEYSCHDHEYDGLTDEEREEYTLMTMETEMMTE